MPTCTLRFIRHKSSRRTIGPFLAAQFDGERWVSGTAEGEVAGGWPWRLSRQIAAQYFRFRF